MLIAKLGLVVIKHLMKHKPTDKLSAHGHHLPRNAYPSTRASQSRIPGELSATTAIHRGGPDQTADHPTDPSAESPTA